MLCVFNRYYRISRCRLLQIVNIILILLDVIRQRLLFFNLRKINADNTHKPSSEGIVNHFTFISVIMQTCYIPEYRTHIAAVCSFTNGFNEKTNRISVLVGFRTAVFADNYRNTVINILFFHFVHFTVKLVKICVSTPCTSHCSPVSVLLKNCKCRRSIIMHRNCTSVYRVIRHFVKVITSMTDICCISCNKQMTFRIVSA